jgi:histone acetyltransferase
MENTQQRQPVEDNIALPTAYIDSATTTAVSTATDTEDGNPRKRKVRDDGVVSTALTDGSSIDPSNIPLNSMINTELPSNPNKNNMVNAAMKNTESSIDIAGTNINNMIANTAVSNNEGERNSTELDSGSNTQRLENIASETANPTDGQTINDVTNDPNVPTMTASSSDMKTSPSSSYESLRWMIVTNDGKPESLVKLIGLKSLFAKQLPKMPRAYIARLVFDRNHTSLAILSDNPSLLGSDEEIIGGICYRNFGKERFAEIAFCAVNASHQVKGYGTKLMNLLKQIAAQQGIEYFITYADNYAIGYFKKQGFTKQITMPKGRYYGLIKDYDGGTPMECYIHPSIDYYNVPAIIEAQRNFILQRIARTALSITTVYPPLSSEFIHGTNSIHNTNSSSTLNSSSMLSFQSQSQQQQQQQQQQLTSDILGCSSSGGISVSRANSSAAKALTIPGVIEAGWTLSDLIQAANKSDDMKQKSSALKQELLSIVRKIEEQQFAWPFREPVTPDEAPDYFDVITNPIDLKTMCNRIRQDNHYKNKQMLYVDLMLMVNNCKLYNDDGSTYTQCAIQLEKYVNTLFHDTVVAMTSSSSSNMTVTNSYTTTTTTTKNTNNFNSTSG